MPKRKIYFDFLILNEKNNALIQRSSAHISLNQLALFEVIALKHSQGQTMTISQAMALQHLASRAALHVRINDLREAGMIQVLIKDGDRRSKYLAPSGKGERYLQLMGKLLQSMCVNRQTQTDRKQII